MEGEDETICDSFNKLAKLLESSSNQDEAVLKYLKGVTFPPVSDFAQGLDWFNVSEALSFSKHLKGKIVLLDFFTYCCINCMHILPELKEIEDEFTINDGFVVVGVHSAKFANEKLSTNILSAVQRYNIAHPVVNDCNSDMWQKCEVICWPTLLLLGPNFNPLVMLMGEGHKDILKVLIRNSLRFYHKQILTHELPLSSAFHLLPKTRGMLLFPGKITFFEGLIAVSDTGNNRILIIRDNLVIKVVGSGICGFKNDELHLAQFNQPQGLCFLDLNTLFIADTNNHAIRKIDLLDNIVTTVAGTGKQGHDKAGGKVGTKQIIASPWDVCVYKRNCDGLLKTVLIIAMAGTHQIWGLFLDECVWWSSKKYGKNVVVAIAGNGREENRNNQYPQNAAFAQPSGLALSQINQEVYIADSESSCIRKLSLINGKVSAVVGGDFNPTNLFAFGDKDGKSYEAKLQHALGLALSTDQTHLYITDTYNHKLKKINLKSNVIETLYAPACIDNNLATFNEPAGLCVDNNQIYLLDTNNHLIKLINLDDALTIKDINEFSIKMSQKQAKDSLTFINKTLNLCASGGRIVLEIKTLFKDFKTTQGNASQWCIECPKNWSAQPTQGTEFSKMDIVITVPETVTDSLFVDVKFNLIICTPTACLPKTYTYRQPVVFDNKFPNSVLEKVKLNLGLNSIKA